MQGQEANNPETRCAYCDGELEYHVLPIEKDKHGRPKTREFATIRKCKNCGKAHVPDVRKEKKILWDFTDRK